MGRMLYDRFAAAREVFREVDRVVPELDVVGTCFTTDVESLAATERTQCCVFTASLASLAALREYAGGMLSPVACLGHSLGQFTALVAAGALALTDGIRLVARRAELMARAAAREPGAMAAVIGLDEERVAKLVDACAGSEVLVVANHNSPAQFVVAGTVPAVGRFVDAAKAAGANRATPLPVSVGAHSPLMAPAADELAAAIRQLRFHRPRWPVYLTENPVPTTSAEALRDDLVGHLCRPVRWWDAATHVRRGGAEVLLEPGPGATLARLCEKAGIPAHSTGFLTPIEQVVAAGR
jgi:[acyl-carrier-protein] S-malonyltransferase